MAMEINLELLDYVDCKIWGKDFAVLSYHLINQHNMTGEDYARERLSEGGPPKFD